MHQETLRKVYDHEQPKTSYFRKRYWREEEKQRKEKLEDRYHQSEEESAIACQNPCDWDKCLASSIIAKTPFITSLLKENLTPLISDPTLPKRGSIFEKAINDLACKIYLTPLQPSLCRQALQELHFLSTGMEALLSKGVAWKLADSVDGFERREGYFTYPEGTDGTGRFVFRCQRWDNKTSEDDILHHANSQFEVKTILGRSTRGKAIAGDDAKTRLGFRWANLGDLTSWTVSIDHLYRLEAEKIGRIKPLSAAISLVKDYFRPPGLSDLGDNKIYTYHFNDRSTSCITWPGERNIARNSFIYYNNILYDWINSQVNS